MTMIERAGRMPQLACAVLAGVVLAGCGGGGATAVHNQQASNGIAVGEPNPAALPIAEFTEMARNASCAENKNRLFVIDGKQVFWDHAGKCADMSYEQVLYGKDTKTILCSHGDTIAGPRTFCQDESARAQFETILKNVDQPDLGLGAGHKVEQLSFLPKAGTAIPFASVAKDSHSGVTARKNVVIKDQAAWEKLWAEHGSYLTPAPTLPVIDFKHKMLVGVFAGEFGNACHSIAIRGVVAGATKLRVEVDERDITPVAICLPVVTHPMHIVAVERSDAEVEFVPVTGYDQPFQTVDQTRMSLVNEPQQVVVKDAAAWARLWAQHAGPDARLPDVDFSKSMVIGVFFGQRGNGCSATAIESILRGADKLRVHQVNTVPGMGVMCTMQVTSPAHLVVTERSDLPVEFTAEERPLK